MDGVKLLLKDVPNIKIIADAKDGNEVLMKLSSYYIDVLLLDIEMDNSDGFVTLKAIKEKYPEIKVLILTMHNQSIYIEKMYQLGASGYLLKNTNKTELVQAITSVYEGQLFYKKEILDIIVNKKSKSSQLNNSALSNRELLVLTLIAKEFSNQQIAEKLHLSVETINSHRKNIMKKLNVKNTAGMIVYAINNNLI
jgi:DNA-binding NarL/FixJ family response regulator